MSVNISRTFVFSDGSAYSAGKLESEITNIIQTVNNANAGLLTWDNVKATTLTLTNAPTFANVIDSGLTVSTALTANASKQLTSSTCTDTELAFVHGVTSAIQTQLNTKLVSPLTANLAAGTNKLTGLGAGTTAGDSVRFEQLKYIAGPVQTATSTATSITSSTFSAATNQSVTITPTSASNRVKVTVSTFITLAAATAGIGVTIKRGTTELSGVVNGFWFTDQVGSNIVDCHFSYTDSPAATTATTYQVFFRNNDNSHSVTCGLANGLAVIQAEEVV